MRAVFRYIISTLEIFLILILCSSNLDARHFDTIAKGVKPRTRITHKSSWKVWLDFCQGEDIFLKHCTRRNGILRAIDFLIWLDNDNRKQGAIKTILSGVRFTFECSIEDHAIFEDLSFKRALAGVGILDGTINLKKAPCKSLVWIVELNGLARIKFWNTGLQDSQMFYIATTLLFHFSLRIGEIANVGPYMVEPLFTEDHRFYWCDLLLEDAHDPSIQYGFTTYKSITPRPTIGLIFLIRNSSKTSGRVQADGKPYYLSPGSTEEETVFFADFLQWIEICNHDSESEPIASRMSHAKNPRMKRTTSKEVVDLLKSVGADHDLIGFTGKSLRGGGSSALSAAGHSDAIMLNSVGHASHSSNQHYQTGSASTNQYALGTGTTISMLDVRRTATINKLIHKPKVRSGASGATPKPLQASSIVSIIKK